MFPLLGQPFVHCSVTGIRSRLFPGTSRPFQFCWYVLKPASIKSRFVLVDVHRICRMGECVYRETVPVSGAPAPGPVIPPIATGSVNLNTPGSQNMFSLSRDPTCAVRRSVGLTTPG